VYISLQRKEGGGTEVLLLIISKGKKKKKQGPLLKCSLSLSLSLLSSF